MPPFIKKRPNVFVALLLLLVAAALFTPYLLQPDSLMWPRSELGTDMLTYNWTSVQYFRDALRETGQFPLWQSTFAGGQPMIGNPAIRVFYPPQLLVSLLPIPILWGYALLNIFHFWLAGMGGYGLARSVLKLDYPAAIIAGLLLMLTPRLSSNVVGDVGYTYGLCWLPLCLLWMRLAFDRLAWRWAILTGLALCFIYLTNIQFILYTVWIVGLYFVYASFGLLAARQTRGVWLRHIGILIIVGVTFIGFSAFQAFTFASYLPYQSRQAMTLLDANYLALPLIGLMNLVFPIAQKFPEWEIYVGLLPLIFAPLSLLYLVRREAGWWVGLLIFAILFSLGSATPLFTLMFYGVPGFNLLRVPARMWYVVAICLALLAAVAINGLTKQKQPPAWVWRWLVGSTFVLMVLTLGGRYITRRDTELDWLLGLPASVGLVLTLFAFWRWQKGHLPFGGLTVLVMSAVLLDLFPLDLAFGTPRPLADFTQPSPIVQRMIEDAGDGLYRVYSTRREISDAVAVANQIQLVEGLNSFQFAAYSRFVRVATGCDLTGLAAAVPPCISNEISQTAWQDARPNVELLGLLNTRYIISALDLSADRLLERIATRDDEHLYKNLAARDRAFSVGRVQVVTGDVSGVLPSISQESVALLDSNQGIDFIPPDNDLTGGVEIVQYAPNQVLIEADMSDDGLMVLGDAWVPGWQAYVDGQQVPTLRINGALRGVYLTSGTHQVTFEFRPTAFVIGLAVTLLTLIIVSGLFIYYRARESSQVIPP